MTYSHIEKGTHIVVAMSGGVDSSVTAHILKSSGFRVSGMIMRLWGTGDTTGADQMASAIEDAGEMADLLDIPLHVVDLRQAFQQTVVNYFINAYKNALTPNPCPVCNKQIKFGLLLEEAKRLGARYLATGHYARIVRDDTGYSVRKGVDIHKDQSYFLYQLDQEQLSRLLFPLGDMLKTEVRELALQNGFPAGKRPESQDLCFIPDNDYRQFLLRHAAGSFRKGPIVDRAGKKLGRHGGLPGYTIGQRRGIGVSAGTPLYVVGMNREDNTLVVGRREERVSHELTAEEVNYISGSSPDKPITVTLRIRYAAKGVEAKLTPLDNHRAHFRSESPLLDVAPGQSAVFFRGDTLLGGGTIEPRTD